MKKLLIILAILATPHIVVQAYQGRNYFAIGGEWFVAPLVMVLVGALLPSVIEFARECLK